MIRKITCNFAALLILLCAATFVAAQTINGTISGTVLDQNGAALPGASIVATNSETGATRTAATNDEGIFTIAGLPVGVYNVRAEKTGFAPTLRENVQVSVSVNTQIEIQVGVGQAEARVDVVSGGELLDTTQSQVSKVIDQ